MIESPPYLFLFTYSTIPSSNQEHQPRHDSNIPCIGIWQIYRHTEQPLEKETSQNESRLEFPLSFSNRDNVRAPIQFGRESQPHHLKISFFFKNRLIHFHVNSTSLIRLVKQNQLSFSSPEINKPLSAHSVSQIRIKFRNQFQLLPQIRQLKQRVVYQHILQYYR